MDARRHARTREPTWATVAVVSNRAAADVHDARRSQRSITCDSAAKRHHEAALKSCVCRCAACLSARNASRCACC
eukprot:6482019-Prymnesium_polylepis.1